MRANQLEAHTRLGGLGQCASLNENWTRRKGMGSSRSADDDLGSGMTKSGVMMGGNRMNFFLLQPFSSRKFLSWQEPIDFEQMRNNRTENWKRIRHCYLGNKWEISFPKNESQSIFRFAVSGFFPSTCPKPWISFRQFRHLMHGMDG